MTAASQQCAEIQTKGEEWVWRNTGNRKATPCASSYEQMCHVNNELTQMLLHGTGLWGDDNDCTPSRDISQGSKFTSPLKSPWHPANLFNLLGSLSHPSAVTPVLLELPHVACGCCWSFGICLKTDPGVSTAERVSWATARAGISYFRHMERTHLQNPPVHFILSEALPFSSQLSFLGHILALVLML